MKTKTINLKKTLVIVFSFMITIVLGQEESSSNNLKRHSFSITPVELYTMRYSEGISLSVDFSFAKKEHIFSIAGSYGSEFVVIFGSPDSYAQLGLLYGREFELNKVVYFDMHAGPGLFFYMDSDDPTLTKFNVPVIAKLRFKTGEQFSLGLKFQANINSLATLYNMGIALQWNY